MTVLTPVSLEGAHRNTCYERTTLVYMVFGAIPIDYRRVYTLRAAQVRRRFIASVYIIHVNMHILCRPSTRRYRNNFQRFTYIGTARPLNVIRKRAHARPKSVSKGRARTNMHEVRHIISRIIIYLVDL